MLYAVITYDYMQSAGIDYKLRIICHSDDDLNAVIAKCEDPSNTCVYIGVEGMQK